jgi:CBS domain-containing protein
MLACGMAAVFSQRVSLYSVDTLHLPEYGVLLPWQVQDLRRMSVAEVMTPQVHTVRAAMRLKEVIGLMQQHRHGGFPVLDDKDGHHQPERCAEGLSGRAGGRGACRRLGAGTMRKKVWPGERRIAPGLRLSG